MNGTIFPIKQAFSGYMREFYSRLYPDTNALREYAERGLSRSIVWAPGRMVDAAEDMLASYQKNENSPTANAGALLPIIIVAMAKDYTPTGGDVGGRQIGRKLVTLTDEVGASFYGYRQAMGDIRAQVLMIAYDEPTARSMAAQFCMYLGEIPNRRFPVFHEFGQYTLEMPCMIETPDVIFQNIGTDRKNLTMLAGDITLRAVIPYLDAPKAGEENDGSTNNPPGYKVVDEVAIVNVNALTETIVSSEP